MTTQKEGTPAMTTTALHHSNVHDACPACGGRRCEVYATEYQANGAVDQASLGDDFDDFEDIERISKGRQARHQHQVVELATLHDARTLVESLAYQLRIGVDLVNPFAVPFCPWCGEGDFHDRTVCGDGEPPAESKSPF